MQPVLYSNIKLQPNGSGVLGCVNGNIKKINVD